MNITIASDQEAIAKIFSLALSKYEAVEVAISCAKAFAPEIRYNSKVSSEEVIRLVRFFDPIRFNMNVDDTLGDNFVEIYLGPAEGFSELNVRIRSENTHFGKTIASDLCAIGAEVEDVEQGIFIESSMSIGGASPFCCQVICWLLQRRGISVVEQKKWSSDDMDVYLNLCDPANYAIPIKQRFEVDVASDDPDTLNRLSTLLHEEGFIVGCSSLLSTSKGKNKYNTVFPGLFSKLKAGGAVAGLFGIAQKVAAGAGIDTERHPVVLLEVEEGGIDIGDLGGCLVENESSNQPPTITLMVQKCKETTTPPTGGTSLERWLVVLRTEEDHVSKLAREELEFAGFCRFSEEPLLLDQRREGFKIAIPSETADTRTTVAAAKTMRVMLLRLGASAEVPYTIINTTNGERLTLILQIPSRGLADGTLLAEISGPSRHTILIRRERAVEEPKSLVRALKGAGFQNIRVRQQSRLEPSEIAYGSANIEVIDSIIEMVRQQIGVTLKSSKRFSDDDDDIYIDLTSSLKTDACTDDDKMTDADCIENYSGEYCEVGENSHNHPECASYNDYNIQGDAGFPTSEFVVICDGYVSIGDVSLTRRPPQNNAYVPLVSNFAHFCLDRATAETLGHVATCAALAEPCMLEGGTSSGKTSVILYLASLLRQPVLRINRKRQPAITFWSVGMSATIAAWRSAGSAFGCPVGRGM